MNVPPPAIPTLTLTLRYRTPEVTSPSTLLFPFHFFLILLLLLPLRPSPFSRFSTSLFSSLSLQSIIFHTVGSRSLLFIRSIRFLSASARQHQTFFSKKCSPTPPLSLPHLYLLIVTQSTTLFSSI